jgi:hypothetical protein
LFVALGEKVIFNTGVKWTVNRVLIRPSEDNKLPLNSGEVSWHDGDKTRPKTYLRLVGKANGHVCSECQISGV